MEVLTLALAGSVVWTMIALRRWRVAGWNLAWGDAARVLGLSLSPGTFSAGPRLKGSAGGLWVEVWTEKRGKHGRATVFRILGASSLPRDLGLSREGLGAVVAKLFGGDDVVTGDAQLDAGVRIQGEPEMALALLDAATRERVAKEVARGVTLRQGELRFEKRSTEGEAKALIGRVRELIDLACQLSLVPGAVPGRLAANAAEDPVPEMRLRCLRLLQESFPGSDHATEASRTALGDRSQAVKLQGALFLGREAFDLLRKLARASRTDPQRRALALEHLLAHDEPAALEPLLNEALSSPEALLRRVAVRGLRQLRKASVLGALVVWAEQETDAGCLAEVAFALGDFGGEAAESGLLALLERPDERVQAAAATALAGCGTARAVEPLLAHTRGLTRGAALKAAARQAVEAIQSRLKGAGAGRLSLSESGPELGTLSFAVEPGRLTEVEPAEDGADSPQRRERVGE